MEQVKSLVDGLMIGRPMRHGRLSVYPLGSSAPESPLRYMMLEEGMRKNLVRIREVTKGGSVPELVVENKAEVPVLIVDGEELVGAKQNRVANLTLLVPAEQNTVIPVSCVERGRWSYRRRDFGVTDNVQNARGRRAKMASVRDSIRRYGSRRSDQGQVWDMLDEDSEALDAQSPTGDMGVMFLRHKDTLDSYVKAITADDRHIGAVFVGGYDRIGLDLFDQPSTFAAMLPKLVRSYAIDGLADGSPSSYKPPKFTDPGFVLDMILHDAKFDDHPAVAMGRDVGITGMSLVGGALVVDDTVVHMTVFVDPDQPGIVYDRDPEQGSSSRQAGYEQRRDALRRRFPES